MKTIWNKERIEELLEDFYKITHVHVGLSHIDGTGIARYPRQGTCFCQALKKSPSGIQACKECDRRAYEQATARKELHVYRCHAGLIEAIVPIRGHNMLLGHLIIGQFRPSDIEKNDLQNLQAYWESLGLNVEQQTILYEDLTAANEEMLKAYTHILQACSAYVWMDDYLRIMDEPLGKQVENYISGHPEEKITLKELAKEFHVGKTTLCNAVKAELGLTVSELLRTKRIELAKQLLLDETKPISEIAALVGIEDYNYFTKVFRQETGVTPSAYRKSLSS